MQRIDMRTVVALILRLFVDEDFPDRLRGTLQPVKGQERLAFQDAVGLLSCLRQVICPQTANTPDDPSTATMPPDPHDKEPQV